LALALLFVIPAQPESLSFAFVCYSSSFWADFGPESPYFVVVCSLSEPSKLCHPERSGSRPHRETRSRRTCGCLFCAVILSASFEREGPRRTPTRLNPPPLSPTKLPNFVLLVCHSAGCRVPHISILRCGFQPQPAAAFFFCQKPQQNRVSSPSTPQNPPNSHQLNHINPKNSWHSSFPPPRIIKAVGNKQTRPISRAFAFNEPPQTIANQRVIRKQNRMNALQVQPAKTKFSP
jgi:hypothetical protein